MFLRGIVPLIGFESATVSYKRGKRNSGESKYRTRDLLSFAFNSILSFSVKPLRFVFIVGLTELLFSAVFFVLWIIPAVKEICFLIIWITLLLSGGNLLAIGIVGEYIGKIFLEVKDRPRYIIEKNLLERRSEK